MNKDRVTIKDMLIWFWLDLREFFGNIEMKIKYLLNLKYFKSLSEKDIPNDTFYCYGGCRFNSLCCPFMDYSKIAGSKYCHYIKGGIYIKEVYVDEGEFDYQPVLIKDVSKSECKYRYKEDNQ